MVKELSPLLVYLRLPLPCSNFFRRGWRQKQRKLWIWKRLWGKIKLGVFSALKKLWWYNLEIKSCKYFERSSLNKKLQYTPNCRLILILIKTSFVGIISQLLKIFLCAKDRATLESKLAAKNGEQCKHWEMTPRRIVMESPIAVVVKWFLFSLKSKISPSYLGFVTLSVFLHSSRPRHLTRNVLLFPST